MPTKQALVGKWIRPVFLTITLAGAKTPEDFAACLIISSVLTRLRQAEGFFAVGGDAGEGPGRIEDDFDVGFGDAGQFEELALDLGGNLARERAAR